MIRERTKKVLQLLIPLAMGLGIGLEGADRLFRWGHHILTAHTGPIGWGVAVFTVPTLIFLTLAGVVIAGFALVQVFRIARGDPSDID